VTALITRKGVAVQDVAIDDLQHALLESGEVRSL